MDMIIGSDVTSAIVNHLREINSMSSSDELNHAIERLFDGEDNLATGAAILESDHIDKIINGKTLADKQKAIKRLISMSVLFGFLSERYVRDTKMDTDSSIDNTIFKREYEDIKSFLSRKSSKHNMSLTDIARRETEDEGFDDEL